MFAILQRLWPGSSNDEIGNAEAVFDAISERSTLGFDYVGTLGEPDVVDRGGNYTTNLHVIIPFTTEPGDPSPPDLEYPLPDGLEDATAEFYEVLDLFGIDDLTELGSIQGKNVPLDFQDGALVPLWDEVMTTDDSEE